MKDTAFGLDVSKSLASRGTASFPVIVAACVHITAFYHITSFVSQDLLEGLYSNYPIDRLMMMVADSEG